MPSQISTIYDNIDNAMAALFPNKLEMSDPLSVENNDEKTLADGYGIHIGSALNSNRQLCDSYSVSRDVIITLSKLNAGTHKSLSVFDDTNKDLLEELHLLIQTINSNVAIRESVSIIDWISDGGIERYLGESRQFLIIRSTFRLEYIESLY
jgi:hypothetical protein